MRIEEIGTPASKKGDDQPKQELQPFAKLSKEE